MSRIDVLVNSIIYEIDGKLNGDSDAKVTRWVNELAEIADSKIQTQNKGQNNESE